MNEHHPIAIVGLAGLFPKARTYRDFWQNIVDGTDCIEEVPASRWRIEDYYDPDPSAPDKTYSTRGGFIPDVPFSPLEWGLPPHQLEVTTVVQMLSLTVARELLQDASAPGSSWYDPSRTGVVLGVAGPTTLAHPLAARLSTPVLKAVVRGCGLSEQDAEEIAARYVEAFPPWEENSFPGLLGNVIAGRVANRLDLGGMNLTVDAACASSLSAAHVAIGELVSGRADMMITGGCDTENSIFGYMCFSKTQALSKSGRIRPFDDGADGTLVGEGIGMLALKRLADAERDGDRIYAVIRGVGASSDGRYKSIYAPRAEGQALALRRAYEDAGCSPASIGLFEAHATGTAVGDRTELTALRELLAEATDDRRFAAIGSVKSQIGHTKGAAGAAGLIKLAMSLYHKTLPPTINVETPNTAVGFADAGFYLNTHTRPWITDPRRPVRRAAASAMGFGGTNFHVVLEEASADRAAVRVRHRTARAYVWHAPDPAALLQLLRSGAEPAREPIPDGHARVGFATADDPAPLLAVALDRLTADPGDAWTHPSGVFYRRSALPGLRIGALFAGQGSQYVNMGLTAVLNNPLVGSAFDEANAVFGDRTLADVVYPPASFDGESDADREKALRRTEHAQPAIGALSAGQFRFLQALGLTCDAFAGHSFGELTALWAAGSLDDAAYFALSRARGQAMAPPAGRDADTGAMLAVSSDRDTVEELLRDHPEVAICNHNAPDQVVVGGATVAVVELAATLKRHGVDAQPLPVAAAFHTELVGHAVSAFREALATVEVRAPRRPVFANSPGAAYDADVAANREVLAEQLRKPVEFVAVLRAMREAGCTVFVEFGPKAVLSRLAERTLGDDIIAIPADLGPKVDGDTALKRAAVHLAVLGAPVGDINRYDAEPPREEAPAGMTVMLNGRDHVPDARRAAYDAAVNGSYQVTLPAAPQPQANGAASPGTAFTEARREGDGPLTGARALPASGFSEIAAQHLDLHTRYLESQSRIANDLVEALRRAADPAAQAAVEAVAGHSLAIGDAHTRANELLADLARLELDGTVSTVPDLGGETHRAVPPQGIRSSPPATPSVLETRTPSRVEPDTMVPSPADPAPRPAGRPDVMTALVRIVSEKTGYPTDLIDPAMDLEADLGVDSIKRVQILGVLRDQLPELPIVAPEQLGELRTLADVVAFLTEGTPSAPEPAAMRRKRLVLRSLPPVDEQLGAYGDRPVAVLDGEDAQRLGDELEQTGWDVIRLTHRTPEDGPDPDDWEAVERDLATQLKGVERVDLCVTAPSSTGHWHPGVRALAGTLLLAKHVLPKLTETAARGTRAAFLAVTRLDGALGHGGTAHPEDALLGGVAGLVKTLRHEAPAIVARAIDLAPGLPADAVTGHLLRELADADVGAAEVGIDENGHRQTPVFVPEEDDPTAGPDVELSDDDVIVVTGGARGVTAACVRRLAAVAGCGEFVLLGRTEAEEPPAWAGGLAEGELKERLIEAMRAEGGAPAPREVERRHRELLAQREIRETLDAVAATGARVRYVTADVTDAAAVREALAEYAPRVTCLVHGAGALADARLADKTPQSVRTVLGGKLTGLRAVMDALAGAPLRHLVLFGSVAGVFGNPGQADYAMANQAFGRLAASWKHAHPEWRVTAIDWGAWDGGMVTPALREMFQARGVALLPPETGAAMFAEQFTAARHDDVNVLIGPDEPLTGTPTGTGGGRPGGPPLVVARDLTGLDADPVIADHRVGEHAVLPASAALGWMAGTLERVNPGLTVVEVRGFDVQRGVVFDGSGELEFRLVAEPGDRDGDGNLLIAASVRSGPAEAPRSHYRGTFVLARRPAPAPLTAAHEVGQGPEDGLRAYADADLFHGPLLQGVRRLLERRERRLVAECRLEDVPVAHGAYASALHSPVLGDVVLQAAAVLGVWFMDAGCLPLAIARWESFAPLPDGRPYVTVVDNLRHAPMTVTVDVSVSDPDGRVLQRLTDVTVVATSGMRAKFREAVRRRAGEHGTEENR